MTIRQWKKCDNEVIAALEKESFSDPWSLEMIEDCFLSFAFSGVVAEENGAVIGYVGAIAVDGEADIVNVCVGQKYRRRGVGRSLMRATLDGLKDKGVKVFYLEVRRSNLGAIALYEQLGFVKVGERKKYYGGTEDAIVYRLDI